MLKKLLNAEFYPDGVSVELNLVPVESAAVPVLAIVDVALGSVAAVSVATVLVQAVLVTTLGPLTLEAGNSSPSLPIGPNGTLLPWEPRTASRTLSWWTDLQKSYDGKEQRASMRDIPRETFAASFLLDTGAAVYLRDVLRADPAAVFLLPVRQLGVLVTADLTGTVATCDTTLADWATVGQRVIVENTAGDTHQSHIADVSGGSITLAAAVGFTFTGRLSRIHPLAAVYLDDRPGAGWYRINAGTWQIAARSIVPLTRLGTGGTAPAAYLGLALLATPSINADTVPETIDGGTELIDAGGLIDLIGPRTVADVQRGNQYRAHGDVERQAWLAFFAAVRGRHRAFWQPTHRPDLAPLSWGLYTITVTTTLEGGASYPAAWRAALVGTSLFVRLADGSYRLVVVESTVDGGATTTLLLVAGAPANLTGTTVAGVSRLELVRLASDDVALEAVAGGDVVFDLPTVAVQR